MNIMTVTDVAELIPNRYPILYIDRVDELVPGEHVVARKNVTFNESFFQGHFPGEPVMPGVLIVEALAQAGLINDQHIYDVVSSYEELLNIVKDAYQLAFEVNTPSVRIHEKGIVLTALQRIEDVNYLHDGIQLIVETL